MGTSHPDLPLQDARPLLRGRDLPLAVAIMPALDMAAEWSIGRFVGDGTVAVALGIEWTGIAGL